jgi:predicted HTH domain antitoxin
MSLIISEDIVKASGLSEEQLTLELIILLFQRKKISIGKASQLAQMPLLQFQQELASRNIYIHYDESDLEIDLKNLNIKGNL